MWGGRRLQLSLAAVGCNQFSLIKAVVGGIVQHCVQSGRVFLFDFFSPNSHSLVQCAHFGVLLFPSAAPIPAHPGAVAAGHWALRGTAERGGE